MTDILSTPADAIHAGLLIGGDTVQVSARIEVRNPAHPDQIVGTVARATPEHVADAVAAARQAQLAWGDKSFAERAEALGLALDRLAEGVDERAVLYVRENGKTLTEAHREIADVAPRARFTLELARELDAQRLLNAPNGRTLVRYLPYGVVVSITPWNAPVSLACMQIVPALLTGNAVVLKPPESCPLALMRTAELMASALPSGLINIVTGVPGEIGDALTMHPDVGKIGFTGSIPSARRILCNAAQSIKSVTSELGGNDAAIVLPDADLGDEAMQRMAGIVFRMTGQVCMAIKRIYVADAIHDGFVDAFSRAVDRIVVGDGLVPGVSMGPLHARAGLDRAKALLAEAKARGASIVSLGAIDHAETFGQGYFMQPTVCTGVPDDARLVTEEQFCPAVPVLRFADIDEALARANDSVYGLGGSVWSRNVDRALDVAGRIEAGAVFVNTHGTNSVNRMAPYGGRKQSGNGRRAGLEGLLEYMQSQTLTTHEH